MTCGRKIGPYDCCEVYCCDCLEAMKAIPDGAVDAVITDPPYVGLVGGFAFKNGGVAQAYKQSESVGDIWRANFQWLTLIPAKAKQLIVFSTHHAMAELLSAIPGKLMLIGSWHKPNAHPGLPSTPHYSCEFFVGCRLSDGCDWRGIDDFISCNQDFGGCISTGERIKDARGNNAHPTQKPLAVMQKLIAPSVETILDPFAGTGTTGVAAAKLGRHYVLFEISEDYCRIARERIALVEAQPSLFAPPAEQLELGQ